MKNRIITEKFTKKIFDFEKNSNFQIVSGCNFSVFFQDNNLFLFGENSKKQLFLNENQKISTITKTPIENLTKFNSGGNINVFLIESNFFLLFKINLNLKF
jgi:alpha-tubulin suppressor-like RCC1 family protein